MIKNILAIAVVTFAAAASAQFPKQVPNMGGGSASSGHVIQSDANVAATNCNQLAAERRAIDQITEKQIWVPIEQQNANYHRMNWLKAQMAARGCSY